VSTERATPQPSEQPQTPGPPRTARAVLAKGFCLFASGLGADASLIYFSRNLGTILALTELASAAVIVLVLLIAILYGSKDTCERAFRLLRWVANQPEPSPNPGAEGS
jgi:xanthine/uracil permease